MTADVSLLELVDNGIRPASYYYAERILAGMAPQPQAIGTDLNHALNYIQEKRMARKKLTTAAEPAGPTFAGSTPPDLAAQEAGARALLANCEDNARAVAGQLGYDGSLSVGALEDEIRFYQRRSIEACIELGKRLLILKELTPHGEFQQRIELLGIHYRMGARFMAATLKFSSKVNSSSLLAAAGTQTKMLELLVLDDSEIAALESGESARGITLDEIETMSVSELKSALREAKEEGEAKDRLLIDKNAKIDELAAKTEKKPRRTAKPWPDDIAGLKDDLHGLGKVMDEAFGKHLTLIDATDVEVTNLDDKDVDAMAAYKSVIHHVGEQIERLCTLAAGLRSEFDTRLGGYIALDKSHILPD